MSGELEALKAFYASAIGQVAARLIRQRLALLWPKQRGARLLGLGYPLPFLRLWREDGDAAGLPRTDQTVACIPAGFGPVRWPRKLPGLTCCAHEERLPFPDLHFDRVLLVHHLEHTEAARRMLREAWRVLKDDGHLLLVVPNRTGWWAYAERTPFGHGRPYSVAQMERLLRGASFGITRREAALFVPPFRWRALLRSAPVWERASRGFADRLGGVLLIEAEKDAFAGVPAVEATARSARVPLAAGATPAYRSCHH